MVFHRRLLFLEGLEYLDDLLLTEEGLVSRLKRTLLHALVHLSVKRLLRHFSGVNTSMVSVGSFSAETIDLLEVDYAPRNDNTRVGYDVISLSAMNGALIMSDVIEHLPFVSAKHL